MISIASALPKPPFPGRLLFFEGSVAGLDEAGRGPLAGPVFAAAVVLPHPPPASLQGIDDSKKLQPAARERLSQAIRSCARACCVAEASVAEIEQLNILQASLLAMRRALQGLGTEVVRALVDGNRDPHLGVPTELWVGGDSKAACIAAASILAKVERDRRMRELHAEYPQYGFDAHKGYLTRRHREALLRHGPCPVHRPSFLRRLR